MRGYLSEHRRFLGFLILLAALALVPLWVESPYYIDLLVMVMVNAGLAITFVMMLRTGLISLCIAAFWGIGAYASAILSVNAGLSFWACLPLSTLITAAFALIIGYVIIRNAGFTFIIMTTVIALLFVTVMGNIAAIGGYNGISNIPAPESIGSVVFDSKVDSFYLGLIIFVVIILVVNAFYSSWAGRAWKAIGFNPRLAQAMGVNVFRYRLLSFVVGCAIAGLLGSFYAHYQTYINPNVFNLFPKTIFIQVYAVLGGVGFATLGPLVGAGLLTFFTEAVTEAVRGKAEYTFMLVGALVILMVVFLPRGILSLGEHFIRLWGWVRRGGGGEGRSSQEPAAASVEPPSAEEEGP